MFWWQFVTSASVISLRMRPSGPSIMTYRPALVLSALLLSLASAAAAQQPVVSFSASSFSVSEKEDWKTPIRFERTGDLNANVSFSVRFTNVQTGRISNYWGSFAKGYAVSTIIMSAFEPGLDDQYYNPGRKYTAVIDGATIGVTIGSPSSADITVIDDEAPPRVTVSDLTVSEGDGTAYFRFSMSTPMPSSLAIPITFHDGSAKNGVDYQSYDYYAVIGPGGSSAVLGVKILPDKHPEGDKTFSIELGTPSDSAVTLLKSTATCTILDDDGAVYPASQRFTPGNKGFIHIDVTDPAPATETVLFQTLGAIKCPASVDIPPGGSTADVEIEAIETGLSAVLVTLPASRGGRTFRCDVLVYDEVTLSLTPIGITLAPGGTTNVTVTMDPPPRNTFTAELAQTNETVADVPRNVTISGAETLIPVHAKAVGITQVTMTLPDAYDHKSNRFVVDVRVPPGLAITSLSQTSGRASGGETVKIFGNELTGACVVTFGGVPSQTSDAPAPGSLNAVTPPHDPGVVDIAVRCGSNVYSIANGFTFTAAPLAVKQLSPASGTARGGTIVTISGTNLRGGLCTATFGGVAAHAFAWNGTTSMTVSTPSHAAGSVPVTLTCGSDSATAADSFNFTAADDAPASISFASPLRVAPGDLVTLHGARFRLDDAITFGTTPASDAAPLTVADTRVVVVPEMPLGPFPISLRDAAGRTTAGPFVEIIAPPAPAIASMPAQLTVGAEFAVTGTGFRRGLTFTLGPAVVQPLSIAPARAVFRVPSMLPGPYSFTISEQGVARASKPADVTTSGLAVTAVAPPCAVREGGTLATISGSGFENGAMVKFGGTYSPDVAWHDGFTLFAKVPPAFSGSDAVLTVVNPSGATATLTGAFVYKSAAEGGCVAPRRRAAGK